MINFKSLATLTSALAVGSVIGIGMAPDQLAKAFAPFATTPAPSAAQVVLQGVSDATVIDATLVDAAYTANLASKARFLNQAN